MDGSLATFLNFELGEPNDHDDPQDGVIFSGVTGRWFDWNIAFRTYAILEFDN